MYMLNLGSFYQITIFGIFSFKYQEDEVWSGGTMLLCVCIPSVGQSSRVFMAKVPLISMVSAIYTYLKCTMGTLNSNIYESNSLA